MYVSFNMYVVPVVLQAGMTLFVLNALNDMLQVWNCKILQTNLIVSNSLSIST